LHHGRRLQSAERRTVPDAARAIRAAPTATVLGVCGRVSERRAVAQSAVAPSLIFARSFRSYLAVAALSRALAARRHSTKFSARASLAAD
jgi:hypothetical protein